MSTRKHQIWVMIPFLGLLLMSPKDIQTKFGRSIASDEPAPVAQESQAKPEVVESKTPKLDALLKDVEIPARANPLNLNVDMLKEDISGLLSRASKAESSYQVDTVKAEKLAEVKSELKQSAIELKQVENSIKDLLFPDDEGDIRARIDEAKVSLEASLANLEANEAIVAQRETPKPEDVKPEVAQAPKPEPERAPSVVHDETQVEPQVAESPKPQAKPDPKPESKPEAKPESDEKDPVLCALQEQNKLLQETLQGFMQQQNLILQQMMNMTQMALMQNMYRTPDTFNYQQMYQYQPVQAGNWVYYPNGLQPIMPGQQQMPQQSQGQSNIFGMGGYGQSPYPQYPQMGQMSGYGQQPQMMTPMQQPQMMNQGGQWGLTPQMGFGQTPSTFGNGGSLQGMGFNFSSGSNFVGMM